LRGRELRKFSRMSCGSAEENENAHGQPRFALLTHAELVGFDPDQNGSLRAPRQPFSLSAALATGSQSFDHRGRSVTVRPGRMLGRCGWALMSTSRQWLVPSVPKCGAVGGLLFGR
jgi:hypothetical protein